MSFFPNHHDFDRFFLAIKYFPVLLVDEYSQDWSKSFQDGLADFQDVFGTSFEYKAIVYKNDTNWQEGNYFL